MKKVLTEIFSDIKENRFLFVIITLQLSVCFLVCVLACQIKSEISTVQKQVQPYGTEECHTLSDNLLGEDEIAFFKQEDVITRLKLMYSMLKSREEFIFYEIYPNPIVLEGKDIKTEFLFNYEQDYYAHQRFEENGKIMNEIKCFWISTNVAKDFSLTLSDGRMWTEEEKNNELIPIVLGSDYQGIFQIGDIINGITPVDRNTTFQVIGILEEGACLLWNTHIMNLDRYVLIPLKDVKEDPVGREERWAQKVLYLFKVTGTLKSAMTPNEMQTIVTEICETCGIYPVFTVGGATNAQTRLFRISLEEMLQIFQSISSALLTFSMLTTIFYILVRIEKNKRYYAILILNGFSTGQLKGVIFGNIFVPVFIAGSVSGIIGYIISIFMYERYFPITEWLLISMAILLTSYIIGSGKIRHFDACQYLGENK